MIWLLSIALGSETVQLATGEDFTCARHRSGQVACWGNNEDKQLGAETEASWSAAPVEVSVGNAVDLAASDGQACVALTTGQVKCWGRTRSERWGTGEAIRSIGVNSGAQVSVGPGRGCVRRRGGYVDCWEAEADRLFDTQEQLGGIVSVGVGAEHACALANGGTVWCWGEDRVGQIGRDRPGHKAVPTQVEGVFDVQALSVGATTTCAIQRSGTVRCWGDNRQAQLGIGDTREVYGPQQVAELTNAAEVSVGRSMVCARTGDGKVFCWGKDPCPRPDAPTRRTTPVDIGIRGATALSQGSLSDHMCALVRNQPVCWGANTHAQGVGSTGLSEKPPETCISLPPSTIKR